MWTTVRTTINHLILKVNLHFLELISFTETRRNMILKSL